MNLARFLRGVAPVALVLTAAFPLAACGGGKDAKAANVASAPMPEGESWTGVYFHPVFGYLHMIEDGTNIVGKWKRTDHSHWGELSGVAKGNVLHYTWTEHQIGMIGPSAVTHGKGYFVYKVNSDGLGELEGQFGLNDDETGSDWHNIKQQRMKPDLDSIGGEEGVAPGTGGF